MSGLEPLSFPRTHGQKSVYKGFPTSSDGDLQNWQSCLRLSFYPGNLFWIWQAWTSSWLSRSARL